MPTNAINDTGVKYVYDKLDAKKVDKEEGKGLSTNDYSDADKSKVDKIDETTTSISGNPISINGLKSNQLAVNPIITLEPIQDLHGQSKPYPAGGGKNLLPLTVDGIKAENTDGTWSGNTYTANGVTFTILVDNANNVIGINISGTSSESSGSFLYLKRSFSVTANSILNGCPSGGSSNTYRLSMSGIGSDVGAGINVPANSTGNVYILRGNTSVSGTVTFKPMIRLATETDATFAPYENICPISGYDKIEVSSCGKNLFDGTYSVTGKYLMADGSEYAGTFNISQYISVKPNTAYYFSNLSGATSACICWYNKTKEFISATNIIEAFMATSPANACYVRASVHNTRTNVCINEGNTAITYVSYHKTTDLSESLGQTVYGLTHEVRTGKARVTRKKVIFRWGDGQGTQQLGNYTRRRFLTTDAATDSSRTNAICDIALYVTDYTADNNHFYFSTDRSAYIFLPNNTDDDTQIEVCYVLETPIEIQLTPHEISLLKDYAYLSTNGTSIALDYHNGELASLSDVAQVGETLNELGEYVVKGIEGIKGITINVGSFTTDLTANTQKRITGAQITSGSLPQSRYDNCFYQVINSGSVLGNGIQIMVDANRLFLTSDVTTTGAKIKWMEILTP